MLFECVHLQVGSKMQIEVNFNNILKVIQQIFLYITLKYTLTFFLLQVHTFIFQVHKVYQNHAILVPGILSNLLGELHDTKVIIIFV